MQYEQDYIMRLIKQVIRALIGTLLNKRTTITTDLLVNRQRRSGDDFLFRLTMLADQGKICEAENILLEAVEGGSDEAYQTALLFYEHINEYSDEFLEDHNFSRKEIRQGVIGIADHMGLYAMASASLSDFDEYEGN